MGDVDQPAIAVVVPTFGRADLLPQLVEALAAQEVAERFEVVVVDDCSVDATPAVLAKLAAASPLSLRVLRTDQNRGPAHARNVGWRATAAPVIAFTDDDCVPTVHWLSELLAAAGDADVVQGRTRPDPANVRRVGPFSRTLDIPVMSPFFETANMCYRRTVLEKVSGFDETFRRGGEDTDLARRAIAAGATVAFRRDALVHHEVHPSSFRDVLVKTRTYEGLVRLTLRYPDLRQFFDGPSVLSRRHRYAALAIGGLLVGVPSGRRAGRRRLLGLLSCVPYARHRVTREPLGLRRRECVVRLPQMLMIDGAELAHSALARWRYRKTGDAA